MEAQDDAEVIEDGCKEYHCIKKRYPGRIPIICSQGPNSDFLDLEKKKFLVCHAMKWKEFVNMVAKQANFSSEHLSRRPLKATVAGLQPTERTCMSDVYKNHKSNDGFLHITVEGFADKLGTHNLDHIAHFVTSALSDRSRDHQKLVAMVEQLEIFVTALESSSKMMAAEAKQFGEEAAVHEINNPQLDFGALAAKCIETTGESFFHWFPWLLCISMCFMLVALTFRLTTTPHSGFHDLAWLNEAVLKAPDMEELQSMSPDKLSKVAQMQLSTIQELTNNLLAQQTPRTWSVGSPLCWILLLAQGIVVAVFFVTKAPKKDMLCDGKEGPRTQPFQRSSLEPPEVSQMQGVRRLDNETYIEVSLLSETISQEWENSLLREVMEPET